MKRLAPPAGDYVKQEVESRGRAVREASLLLCELVALAGPPHRTPALTKSAMTPRIICNNILINKD